MKTNRKLKADFLNFPILVLDNPIMQNVGNETGKIARLYCGSLEIIFKTNERAIDIINHLRSFPDEIHEINKMRINSQVSFLSTDGFLIQAITARESS
jgi:hypothetical protein